MTPRPRRISTRSPAAEAAKPIAPITDVEAWALVRVMNAAGSVAEKEMGVADYATAKWMVDSLETAAKFLKRCGLNSVEHLDNEHFFDAIPTIEDHYDDDDRREAEEAEQRHQRWIDRQWGDARRPPTAATEESEPRMDDRRGAAALDSRGQPRSRSRGKRC